MKLCLGCSCAQRPIMSRPLSGPKTWQQLIIGNCEVLHQHNRWKCAKQECVMSKLLKQRRRKSRFALGRGAEDNRQRLHRSLNPSAPNANCIVSSLSHHLLCVKLHSTFHTLIHFLQCHWSNLTYAAVLKGASARDEKAPLHQSVQIKEVRLQVSLSCHLPAPSMSQGHCCYVYTLTF